MTAKIRARSCTWPRFSRYEFRDGRVAPVAGAKMHPYDPWRDYSQAKSKNREEPPYISLASLVDKLRKECQTIGWTLLESGGVAPQLSKQSIDAILAWTARWGLLGVFHQTTLQFEDPSGGEAWTRAGGRWHHLLLPVSAPASSLVSLTVEFPDLERRTAHDHITKFLIADLPPQLPAPDSEEFFRNYGEPLWDWLAAALTVADAIFQRDEDALNTLAGAAGRMRHFESDHVRSQIVFPSLLSAFAEMAWQDLEGGNLIGKCGYCDGLFITDRKWTAYCGPQCATKERQRRFLEKNPTYYRRPTKQQITTRSKRGKVKSS